MRGNGIKSRLDDHICSTDILAHSWLSVVDQQHWEDASILASLPHLPTADLARCLQCLEWASLTDMDILRSAIPKGD